LVASRGEAAQVSELPEEMAAGKTKVVSQLDTRRMRLNFGLTEEWWAKRLSVSVAMVQEWETNGFPVTAENMALLGRRLHTQGSRVMSSRAWMKFYTLQCRAIGAVGWAVKLGKLPKATELTCVDCGKPATQYEHRDYTKPLEIDPVCRKCNHRRGLAVYTLLWLCLFNPH